MDDCVVGRHEPLQGCHFRIVSNFCLEHILASLGEISLISNVGNSAYHSARLNLERRFGQGFFFLASYTWSKSIDNVNSPHFGKTVTGGVQNVFDPQQNRAVSDWDVPRRLAYSFVYDLPFGRGQRWMASAPSFGETIIFSHRGTQSPRALPAVLLMGPDHQKALALGRQPYLHWIGSILGLDSGGPQAARLEEQLEHQHRG